METITKLVEDLLSRMTLGKDSSARFHSCSSIGGKWSVFSEKGREFLKNGIGQITRVAGEWV